MILLVAFFILSSYINIIVIIEIMNEINYIYEGIFMEE
jgi:hypothetical protein